MDGGNNNQVINEVIIDITGEANLNFHGIPLNAIKKASFLSKVNTLAALLKMTVNNVTYDFQKTAKNGAVVFGGDYGLWDFVAPDGRFDFSSYQNLTIGQTLLDMESILRVSPVPAWDTFIRWVRDQLDNLGINTEGITSCFVTPIGIPEDRVQANVISLDNLTDCVSFIQTLEHAIAPLENDPLSTYITSDTSFGFTVICQAFNSETGVEQDAFALSFQFKQ